MGYFEDVYLKRVNRYGNSLQGRVHGRMEHDFEHMMAKSVNKVKIFGGPAPTDRELGQGVLQSKDTSEKETIDYLLTPKKDVYANGTILYLDGGEGARQPWMILFMEKYQTMGYNKYKVILLENTISWVDKDKILRSSLVHYTGNGGARDKAIAANFKISFENIVNIPNRTLFLILPQNTFLTRGTQINISDITWEVSGYDNISVPGVMYVTLEEHYIKDLQQINEELDGWSFSSDMGDPIYLQKNVETPITFKCYYNGELRHCVVDILKTDIINYSRNGENSFAITSNKEGVSKLTAFLAESPQISFDFEVYTTAAEEEYMGVSAPEKIKVNQQAVIIINTNIDNSIIQVTSKNNHFSIDKIEENNIYITGQSIGDDVIIAECNSVRYETPIEIVSMWM